MSEASDLDRSQRASGTLIASFLFALVAGGLSLMVILAWQGRADHATPVWFVGMLIVTAAALTMLAIVFRWLGLQGKDEAFGLPPGSVRTLLAVGVMVLFTVFGLSVMSGDSSAPRPSKEPFATAAAAATPEARASEVADYARRNIVAVATAPGGASSPTQYQLYWIEGAVSEGVQDMRKQVVTALVTLLTSVVSFYFGSRSVETARSGSGTPPTLPEATRDRIETTRTQLAGLDERLQRLKAATAQDPANAARLADLVTRLDAAMAEAMAARDRLDAQVKDLSGGVSTPEATEAAALSLQKQVAALEAQLTEAEALVAHG